MSRARHALSFIATGEIVIVCSSQWSAYCGAAHGRFAITRPLKILLIHKISQIHKISRREVTRKYEIVAP